MSSNSDLTVRPLLVLTSNVFLIPIWKYIASGYYIEHPYQLMTQMFFYIVSFLFHTTRLDVFFVLDRIAIINQILVGLFVVHQQSAKEIIVFWTCIAYAVISYIVGSQYSIFAFDPDFYIQQFWHSLNHFFISYVAWVICDYKNLRSYQD